ncbi:MAG: hypothetical protein AB1894_26340 [Chloroflexota bacterium]
MQRIEFGSDGIRGKAGIWPFISPVAYEIGQALGQYVSRRSEHPVVVMGRDTRPSGLNLSVCIASGLMSQGADTINLGVMTTPGVAFLTRRQKADLGVIISASHSPLEMNGIKIFRESGLRLQREEEVEIELLLEEAITRATTNPIICSSTPGKDIEAEHLIAFYIQDHVRRCPVESLHDLRIVLDCADGAASVIAPEVFLHLGANPIAVNKAVDGKGINYQCGSEYAILNPMYLAGIARDHGANYGFAFDGDGDRLIVVDNEGNSFDGHDLLYILAKYFKTRGLLRKNTVVTNYRANRGLEKALKAIGIRTAYTSNGDRHLEAAMWGKNYMLGGEPGGNIIVNDGSHTAADGIYTALLLAGILKCSPEARLMEMVNPLRESLWKYPQITKSFKPSIMLTAEQIIEIQREISRKQKELGGERQVYFWSASTEPRVYRIMVQGSYPQTQQDVKYIVDELSEYVRMISSQ